MILMVKGLPRRERGIAEQFSTGNVTCCRSARDGASILELFERVGVFVCCSKVLPENETAEPQFV
jgi:hypothetical protein